MSLIKLENVTKAYYMDRKGSTARIVLDEVSIEFQENEFVCLIGPSGCGKTTVLNLVAGFEKPTLGEVTFKGNAITGPGMDRGVVFQEYSLFPWMSVIKNIEFALECENMPEKEWEPKAMEALTSVGLAEFANQRTNILSGGMKQRVAIARLLAMDSEVLLMDEPFSALDEQTRSVLDKDIVELWRNKKKTVIFVTHSIDEALTVATRIILFSDSPGKVIGEWNIPKDMPRSMDNEFIITLKKEIIGAMPVCECMRAPETSNVR